jgi:hypothetical protein
MFKKFRNSVIDHKNGNPIKNDISNLELIFEEVSDKEREDVLQKHIGENNIIKEDTGKDLD